MQRAYPQAPIVAVGAIILDQDKVLLIRRGQQPFEGEWSLPGGALDTGETLEQGVRREVLEETGLVVEPLAIVEVVDSITRDQSGQVQYHYVIIDYLCRPTGGVLACASDAAEVRWTSQDEVRARDTLLIGTDARTGIAIAADVAAVINKALTLQCDGGKRQGC